MTAAEWWWLIAAILAAVAALAHLLAGVAWPRSAPTNGTVVTVGPGLLEPFARALSAAALGAVAAGLLVLP